MRVTLKALTVATTTLWLLFMTLGAALAYSAGAVKAETGEVRFLLDSNRLVIEVPISVDNGGFFHILSLEVRTVLYDWHGRLLAENTTFIDRIPYGSNMSFIHKLTADLSGLYGLLMEPGQHLLLKYEMRMNYAGILPIRIHRNMTIQLLEGTL